MIVLRMDIFSSMFRESGTISEGNLIRTCKLVNDIFIVKDMVGVAITTRVLILMFREIDDGCIVGFWSEEVK